MSVITLSREYGSGGDEIVQMICRETGYQTFDKEMIAHAAVEAGISESEALAYSESEYRVSGFLDRILGRQAPAAEVRVRQEKPDGIQTVETMPLDEDQALQLVQKAVELAYQRGSFVIVGRGGQVILRDLPGVLHVRVIASIEERILRVRNRPEIANSGRFQQGYSSTPYDVRRAAQDLIESRDRASQDYLKRNYSVNWNDPQLYDVILNTTHLDLGVAAGMIIQAAKMLDR